MKKIIKNSVKFVWKAVFAVATLLVWLILIIVLINNSKTPEMNREWEDDSKILPDVTIASSSVMIKNIRDWRYEKGKVISAEYYDDVFKVEEVKKAYLLFNPFGQWAGVGHSFFVFEFSNGKEVSFSIEARREKGEEYTALKGLFNKYEIWYAVGSSADFLTRRAIYHDEDLYMYPLLISEKSAQGLFLDMAKATEKLETEPGFYNTVTSNCTNLLADSANRVKPDSVPFHYSRLFTGYADDQLYDLGFIPNDKPFEQIFTESRIDLKIKELFEGQTDYSRATFWHALNKN